MILAILGLVLFACAGPAQATSPPASRFPWPESIVARHLVIAPSTAVPVPGTPYILGTEPDTCQEPCSEPLVRVDVDTGALKVGPVLSADSHVEIVGHSVVVITAHKVFPDGVVSGGWGLRSVDVGNLRLGPVKKLPPYVSVEGVTAGSCARGGDFWAASGQNLLLLDAATGLVLKRVHLPLETIQLAVAPNHDACYLLGYVLGRAPEEGTFIEELDAQSGRRIAVVSQPNPPNGEGPRLTPTDRGVWVVNGKGAVRFLSEQHLEVLPIPKGALPPDTLKPGVDPITVAGAGPLLLIWSSLGMTCVDPDSGVLRAAAFWSTTTQRPTWTAVETRNSRLIVIGAENSSSFDSDLGMVDVPSDCFG